MNTSPKVSVCIDVYNYADFLPEAIESVLAQTWTDFELLIVDDCSTDDSFAIAEDHAKKDERIRVHRNATNRGMVVNRNVCLSLAQGEYVKLLHADDFLCSPDALSRMVALMDSNPAISLVAAAMRPVDARSQPQNRGRQEVMSHFDGKRLIAGTSIITRCLREQKNLIGGPSATMFRRKLAARGFDERYFHSADLEMWFHLLEQGCFGYINEPLVAYRWHKGQQTAKDRGTLTQADDQRALLQTYLDKPYVRLRSWLKEYLRHDAVRQTVRRGRKLGLHDRVNEVVREHGQRRYLKSYLWCALWKQVNRHAKRYSQTPVKQAPALPTGINVAGFLKGEYGIGESSRAFCRAVETSGLSHVFVNVHSRDHRNQAGEFDTFSDQNPYNINLMTFSFDYARRFWKDQGTRYFEGRHNVALWYWELETFPARWHSNFDFYDEIWVPSRFCRDAIAAVSPIPVHKITYPFFPIAPPVRNRAPFSLSQSAFVFLFTFDFYSSIARKNPLGTIAAFKRAFGPDDDVVLVLKSINGAHRPSDKERVMQAAQGVNIICVDEHWGGDQVNALFAAADCYVSLHRSEGLGLGMAQAMSLGKPVIATNYSGNLEYMNAKNSLLVEYKRVELQDNYEIYEKGNVWAEPDIEHAAGLMRWVFEHQTESEQLGERARGDVHAMLNPALTREEILVRVHEISAGK